MSCQKKETIKMAKKGKGRMGMRSRLSQMQQLQELQAKVLETQEALGQETVSVSVGGGAITLEMTGHQKVHSIKIDPQVVDPDDVQMLEDLVTAAINEAVEKSQELATSRLSALTGGMKIPGLM